jgi:hypothetical protein
VRWKSDKSLSIWLTRDLQNSRRKGSWSTAGPCSSLRWLIPLDEEGLKEAVVTELPVDRETNVRCRVLRAEHLVAKALAVGRPKDHVRLTQFIESGRYDAQYFCEVLDRNGLSGKWRAFCEKFDVTDPCSGLKP